MFARPECSIPNSSTDKTAWISHCNIYIASINSHNASINIHIASINIHIGSIKIHIASITNSATHLNVYTHAQMHKSIITYLHKSEQTKFTMYIRNIEIF